MFCSNCGTEIDPNGKFCSNCGTNLVTKQTDTVKTEGLQHQIRLMFDAYWGIPAKKGAVICLDDKIVLKPRGFDFLLGTSLAGAAIDRILKENDANFHLFDAANQVINVDDIERIELKRKKLARDSVTIVHANKKSAFFAQNVPELFETL